MCKSGFCTLLLLPWLPHLADGGKVPGLCDCLSAEAASRFVGHQPGLEEKGINVSTYGIGCARHDLNTTPCAELPPECENVNPASPHCEAPEWCESEWCWVDPERCSLSMGPAVSFVGRTYSYATCGYYDFYKRAAASLAHKVVKVGWKVNTGGWMGVYHPTGESYLRDGNYFGPTAAIVKKAAEENDWIMNSTGIPEEVAPLCPYTSSFSCCVWAAGLGYLDICATEATVTTVRATLAEFYHTSDETSHLIVNSTVTWLDLLLKPFRPFEPLSWLCIFAVVGVVLVARLIPRVHMEGPLWLNLPRRCCWRGDSDDSVVDIVQMQHSIAPRWQCSFCGFKMSLLKASPRYACAGCGLQLFFELLFATYTANLFLHLVFTEEHANVQDMEQVRKNGMTVCIQRVDAVGFMQEYPHVKYAVDPADGEYGILARDDIFSFMDDGRCDVGISTRQDFERMQGQNLHCSKMMFEAAVWNVPMGIAVNPGKSGPIRSALHELRESGYWLEQLKESRPSADECNQTSGEETSLALPDMLGLLAITGSIMVFGYCFDLVRWRKRLKARLDRRRARDNTELEIGNDGMKQEQTMGPEETDAVAAEQGQAPHLTRKHQVMGCAAEALTSL